MNTVLFIASLAFSVAAAVAPLSAQDKPIDFGRDIQPILSENCYYCHGQDGNERQADLRLDDEESAKAVFTAGDPENSELYLRICSTNQDEKMPPPDSNRSLNKDQIGLIKRWIKEGAKWSQHWAFAPIDQKEINSELGTIDFYVQRRLSENRLDFSPQASRNALLRRVSLDLTGLPPTPEQARTYLNDKEPGAYERMVDRFLDSPAYGERMAWVWLDAARYADSNGYQGDNERTMWPWRDWVVKAYNENMPFDQFSKWQIAGDLLPNATNEQILATGFNRNHPINGEGGRIAEENRIDYVMDMAETTGTIWMGLTFNCCRCHDHKYDQLTQNDYYSLFAFFNQTPIKGGGGNAQTPPVLAMPSKEQKQLIAKQQAKVDAIDEEVAQRGSQLADAQPAWEQSELKRIEDLNQWSVVQTESFFALGAKTKTLPDKSLLTFGFNRSQEVYQVIARTDLEEFQSVRLEVLPHETMTKGGLSRSSSSNFVLTDFAMFLVSSSDDEPKRLKFSRAIADYEQLPVKHAIDEDSKSGWAVWAKGKDMRQPHEAVFTLENPVTIPEGGSLKFVLKHQSEHKQHNIGRFKLSLAASESAGIAGLDSELATALSKESGSRSAKQKQQITDRFFRQDKKYLELSSRRDSEAAKLQKLKNGVPKVMVMADMPKPRKTFRLDRGSYQQPLNEVSARVPSMLASITSATTENSNSKAKPLNRLSLANWLFEKSNPLTPRVTVNRLWAQFFGIGLVKTTEDFGVQGEPPSHPELLDAIAAEYRDSGWDTKKLVREILTSRTYKQTSKVTPHLLELDPENRLLGRSTRFRMPSWMLRDVALAASGRLVRELGGKPVNTYQPAGVWEEASFGKKKFQLDSGDALYRRSLYTFWRRIASPTMFFDNADRMTCSVKAFRTNTPLHALGTLNDTTFVEASRLLATQILQSSDNKDDPKKLDQSRLDAIFMRVVTRKPTIKESNILLSALNRTRKQFDQDKKSAQKFIGIGESPTNENVDPVELASWTSLCLAIINLDEALTRQ